MPCEARVGTEVPPHNEGRWFSAVYGFPEIMPHFRFFKEPERLGKRVLATLFVAA
jgi:hypothetical protein